MRDASKPQKDDGLSVLTHSFLSILLPRERLRMPPRNKPRRVIPSSSSSSDSQSSIASSSSSTSPPSTNEKPPRSNCPAVNAKGGGLSFTTARPTSTSTSQQRKLFFAKRNGPIPSSRKKVKIQEPLSPSLGVRGPPHADVKGKGKQVAPTEDDTNVTTPWSQRYSPQTRDELAVHNRKIRDVATWLKEAFYGSPALRKRRRFLVLTGPAGSAKTETILQLARDPDLDFEVIEWKNETQSRAAVAEDGNYELAESSLSARLRDFLSKSARFPTLSLGPMNSKGTTDPSTPSSIRPPTNHQRRLILLEDLPSLSHQPTLDAFQDALSMMLAHTSRDPVPVCIILSDINAAGLAGDSSDGVSSSSSKDRRETEWMRPRRLLGDDIANSDSWAEIKFNPIATTFLKKALKVILNKAKVRYSLDVAFPADPIIDVIAIDSPGDIRAATDILQQAYQAFLRDSTSFAPLLAATKRVNRKRINTAKVVRQEASKVLDNLGLVSRDSALVLFHALGKLLYNKRVGDPDDKEEDADDDDDEGHADMDVDNGKTPLPLPDHYQHLARRTTRVDVTTILNSNLDLSTLSLFAHHNFPSYVTDIDQCEGILDSFSFCDSELRLHQTDQYAHTNLHDHYTSLITSHSLLLHLPSPVPRKVDPPRGAPTKPDYFEAVALMRAEAQSMGEVARRVGLSGSGELKNARELALEWVPMVGKMVDAAARPKNHSNTAPHQHQHLVHRLRSEHKDELRRCNNFYPGLTPFASQASKRFGWNSTQASFDKEEEEMQDLILRGGDGDGDGNGNAEDASTFTEVDRAEALEDKDGIAVTGMDSVHHEEHDDAESGASDMEDIDEF